MFCLDRGTANYPLQLQTSASFNCSRVFMHCWGSGFRVGSGVEGFRVLGLEFGV